MIRTDLALEAHSAYTKSNAEHLKGAHLTEQTVHGFPVSVLEITDDEASQALQKPIGRYANINIGSYLNRREGGFDDAVAAFAEVLSDFLYMSNNGITLIVGLGNRALTADDIGPLTIENLIVTRHLIDTMPEVFGQMRPVAALETGVLGITGIESSEIVAAVCERVKPEIVIAIDALAARETTRLGTTIQISDSGIVPGSGVGNSRKALSEDTLKVPVISVGVPTVIDGTTLVEDLCGKALDGLRDLFVTPREIDSIVHDCGKVLGYGINMALLGLNTAEQSYFL